MSRLFSKTSKFVLPVIILSAGIFMMMLGILRGELQMIYQKAILICMECIGIG